MKLFKLFLTLFFIVAAIFVTSLFFPNSYSIDRHITINKPSRTVFLYMSDFRNWNEWSLWNTSTDSSLITFYGQRSDSLGGRMYFKGNLIGTGRFMFTGYIPHTELVYNLWMNKGEVNANGKFIFLDKGNVTEMHWLDSGYVGYNPLFRFMIPSKIKSTQQAFDEGLARIKKGVESK